VGAEADRRERRRKIAEAIDKQKLDKAQGNLDATIQRNLRQTAAPSPQTRRVAEAEAKAAEEALATEDARLAAEAKTAAETVATVAAVAAAAAHPPKVEEAPGGRASVAIGPGVVGNVLSSAEEAASIDAALWALSLKLGGGSAKELLEAILAAMPHRAHPLVGEALTAARARLRELRGN